MLSFLPSIPISRSFVVPQANTVEFDVKLLLFDSLCSDMYGIETWWSTQGAQTLLKPLAVSYHYALKKLIGLPKHASNHYACYLLDRLIFNHFHVYEMVKFYMWIRRSTSPCLAPYKYHMLNRSILKYP